MKPGESITKEKKVTGPHRLSREFVEHTCLCLEDEASLQRPCVGPGLRGRGQEVLLPSLGELFATALASDLSTLKCIELQGAPQKW